MNKQIHTRADAVAAATATISTVSTPFSAVRSILFATVVGFRKLHTVKYQHV